MLFVFSGRCNWAKVVLRNDQVGLRPIAGEENKLLYIARKEVAAAAAKSRQSCLTLCDPIDSNPPGSSVHGVFQARVLEWGTIAFSTNMLQFYLTVRRESWGDIY